MEKRSFESTVHSKLSDLCRRLQRNIYVSGHTTRSKFDLETEFEDTKRDSNRTESYEDDHVKPPPIPPKRNSHTGNRAYLGERVMGCQSATLVDTCGNDRYMYQVNSVRTECQTFSHSLDVIVETDEFIAWSILEPRGTNRVNNPPKLTGCNRDSGTWV